MQTVARKQLIAAAITIALLISAVSVGGIVRDVSAQTGTLAATRPVSVGQTTGTICPDTTKTIITPTATQTSSAATMAATVETSPVTFASSRLTKQLQPGEFGILHTILDFNAGVTSAPYFFQGTVNLIVIQGQITYCSGSLQRVLIPGDSWTIPPQVRFILANAGSDMARLSVVVIEPTPTTATAAATMVSTTTPPTLTRTPLPATAAPTQAGTATGVAYIGIRAVAVDNTGVRVAALLNNSPAAAAQVQVGDVITAVDGQVLASLVKPTTTPATPNPNGVAPIVTAFFQVIERHRPGDTVQLTIQRNNQTLTINVKLGVLPSGS